MAAFAIGGGMRTQQGKTGQVMIEKDIVLPGCFVVTVVADNALLTLMGIIFLMAGVAVRLQFNLENGFDMTGLTLDGLMSAV